MIKISFHPDLFCSSKKMFELVAGSKDCLLLTSNYRSVHSRHSQMWEGTNVGKNFNIDHIIDPANKIECFSRTRLIPVDYSYFNIDSRRDGATWNSYFLREFLDKTNFLNIKERQSKARGCQFNNRFDCLR